MRVASSDKVPTYGGLKPFAAIGENRREVSPFDDHIFFIRRSLSVLVSLLSRNNLVHGFAFAVFLATEAVISEDDGAAQDLQTAQKCGLEYSSC